MATCYMCSQEANTVEHVPPKCIFPEMKDSIDNQNYKVDLITVPSCELHNTAKSVDDVYLLFCLAVNILSNEHASQQMKTKVSRAVTRTPHVYKAFTEDNKPVLIKEDDGSFTVGQAIKINRERFDSSIDHIARGLYHYHNKSVFSGESQVITNSLIYLTGNNVEELNRNVNELCDNVEKCFGTQPYLGKNPEIFMYRMHSADLDGEIKHFIQMKFYGEFNVVAILSQN